MRTELEPIKSTASTGHTHFQLEVTVSNGNVQRTARKLIATFLRWTNISDFKLGILPGRTMDSTPNRIPLQPKTHTTLTGPVSCTHNFTIITRLRAAHWPGWTGHLVGQRRFTMSLKYIPGRVVITYLCMRAKKNCLETIHV